MKTFKTAKAALVLVVLFGLVRFPCAAQERTLEPSTVKESSPPLPPLDLPLMDPKSVPDSGTFFMATHAASADGSMPPWPFNPLASLDVPVYWLGSYDNTGGTRSGLMLVDDRIVGSVEKALAAMQMLDRANKGLPLIAPTIALRSSAPPPSTNELWLQLHDDDMTNGFVRLTLHNTLEYWPYQLLLRTNLGVPDEWTLGEIISGASATNQTDFSPVAIGETNHMLFRAHHAEAVVVLFASATAYEAVGGFPGQEGAFTVIVSSTNDVTVYYKVSGTASNGLDYTNLTGSITIPAGTGSVEVRVKPIQDSVVEGDETVVVTLVQTNYLINGSPTATVLLSDSSTVLYPYASFPSLAIETNGPPGMAAQDAVFGLYRNDDRGLYPDLDVFYQVNGTASNGVDYALLSGVVHFGDGVNDTNITIVPFADSIIEGLETVTVTVVQSNGYRPYTVGDATVTIDDTSTTVSIGSTYSNNCIELDGPVGVPATPGFILFSRTDTRGQFPEMDVYYRVSGTASNGIDYSSLSGIFHFATNISAAYLHVNPLADTTLEGEETVMVSMFPTNGYLVSGATSGAVAITDTSTTVSLASTGSNNCIELDGPVGIPARLGFIAFSRTDTRGLFPEMDAYYQVTGTASNGVDYSLLSGVFRFAANVSSARLPIFPLADTLAEGVEVLAFKLLPTNGYLNGITITGLVTIIDSSTTVTVASPANNTCYEQDGPPGSAFTTGYISFSRTDTRGLLPEMDVFYQVSGTAINGLDYSTLSGVFHFATNVSSNTLTILPLPDTVLEGTETVVVTLTPTNGYINSVTNTGSATIFDSSTTVNVLSGANATELNPASPAPGQAGFFTVIRTDTRNQYPALTAQYQITGGTAVAGIDFTNLPGVITFGTNVTSTNIPIQTIADDVIEGDETVTVSLMPTDGYFVDSNAASATLTIFDNVPFIRVVTNLSWPIGIDNHSLSNSLIVSCNYASNGFPLNFARIYTNMVLSNSVFVTNTVTTGWSGVRGQQNEVKLAIVQTNAGGFTNGDMFFGSDTGIGWVSADGTRSNLNWCVLTNSLVTNTMLLRGSVCVDRTGIFSNHLICVTSGGQEGATRDVWRVDAQAHPTLLARIPTLHLEGVTTLPNDPAKYGPWAGKIITGDETVNPPRIYTIDTNGVVATNDTTTLFSGGIHPEDFDIIPVNHSLYGCDPGINAVVKISSTYFTNFVGDLLVTDGGEAFPFKARLFIIHWDATTTNFIKRTFNYGRADGSGGQLEHVTFAPLELQKK